MEEDAERMVKTPWSEEEIPFTQAAEIGTDKVMRDHSTIGLVITTDGSIENSPEAIIWERKRRRSWYAEKVRKTLPCAGEQSETLFRGDQTGSGGNREEIRCFCIAGES